MRPPGKRSAFIEMGRMRVQRGRMEWAGMRVRASARIGERVQRDEQDARTERKIGMGRDESL